MSQHQPITAQCYSSGRLANGLRSEEFRLEYQQEEWHERPKQTEWYYDVITEIKSEGLRARWTIHCEYYATEGMIDWNEIELHESSRRIYGNYVIRASKTGHTESNSFDSDHLPFRGHLPDIEIDCRHYSYIHIKIFVFYNSWESLYSLADDYEKLLENRELSDVVFVLGSEDIHGHKQVIAARNEVFAKMFNSDMVEKKDGRVEIIDIEPKIFKFLLKFIYSEKIDTDDVDDLLKLIVAADKYSVKNLVSLLERILAEKLTEDNVVEVLMTAELLKVERLKEECMTRMRFHKYTVDKTAGFKRWLSPVVQICSLEFPVEQDIVL